MEAAARLLPTSYCPLGDPIALLDALEAAQFNVDLSAVINAINRRTSTIVGNRVQAALVKLNFNDRVRIANQAKPHYMRGERETVRELNDDYADRLVGKFTSRHLMMRTRDGRTRRGVAEWLPWKTACKTSSVVSTATTRRRQVRGLTSRSITRSSGRGRGWIGFSHGFILAYRQGHRKSAVYATSPSVTRMRPGGTARPAFVGGDDS